VGHASALCLWLVSSWAVAPPQSVALAVCHDVAAAALVEGVPVELALALAYTESRLNPTAESSRGALGPLQVVPWFHCPGKRRRGCDLVGVGVRTMLRFLGRFGPSWRVALCHWNSGNRCYRRSRLFSRIVLRRAEELQSIGAGRCGG